jgi:hypothetical protein
MDHKEKNIASRKQKQKSRRAHLRQLQKCYDNLRECCIRLQDENQQLRTEYFTLVNKNAKTV